MVKCHGATPRLIHSRAPSLILADEPSSWLHTQSAAMVSGLLTGLGKIKDGRACFSGPDQGDRSIFFRSFSDGNADFVACYATPKELWENKPFTLGAIRRANPSLSHMPDYCGDFARHGDNSYSGPSLPWEKLSRQNSPRSSTRYQSTGRN